MDNEKEIITHFINYEFSTNKDMKSKLYKNFISKSYYNERDLEHKELQKQIKVGKLDINKMIDRNKIEIIEETLFINTIYFKDKKDGTYIIIDNIEEYKKISATKKMFLIQLKKGYIDYNPDYYDTILGKTIESDKMEYYIDDISQEVLFTVDYELLGKDEYLFKGTISFMNNIELKIKKDIISHLICNFFAKYGEVQTIIMNDFDYAFSTDKLSKLVKATDKLLWIKYKEIPKGMKAKAFKSKFPKEYKEEDYYADIYLSKTKVERYRKDKSLKSFLDNISDLESLRIKTTSGLIKDEEIRYSMEYNFVINSKFNFVDPTEKEEYRNNVYDKITKEIKF